MSGHNPVRVMHFIHSLKYGGAERQLAYLVQHSDPQKIRHAVCCFNEDGREILDPHCDLFPLDRKNKFDFKWREIYKLISDWEPDIVHNWLRNVQVNSFFPARWYGKTIYLNSYRSAVKLDSLYRVFEVLVHLLGDALVSITAGENLFFPYRQIYHLKKGSFIPIGIPAKALRGAQPALPENVTSQPDQTLLLYVGRLAPEKNIPLLLQAFQCLLGEYKGLRLLICGDGQDREKLLELTRNLGIGEGVTFLGYQEDVYPIMKACDLLVFPSFREGMGNVLFEALAAGLPAIASNIPSLAYWFKDREVVSLFDPYSLEELTACIREELQRSDDERNQRRQETDSLIAELDVDTMVRKYTDLYRNLVQ